MKKIYLVGGAIRDKLLKINVTEKDYVVVGSSPDEMVKEGFIPVGKDFPVFINPKNSNEYALARTERKAGVGYKGFQFYTGKKVTLEEDLKRRDLTINAIAEDENGNLYDPFNGIADLKNKIFRHVSQAFSEDPLRLIRLARFSAKLPEFTIDNKTKILLKDIVSSEELLSISGDRIFKEIKKTFGYKNVIKFFETLNELNALNQVFDLNKDFDIKLLESFFKNNNQEDISFNIYWLFFERKFGCFLKNKVNFSRKDIANVGKFFELRNSNVLSSLNSSERIDDFLIKISFYQDFNNLKLFSKLFILDDENNTILVKKINLIASELDKLLKNNKPQVDQCENIELIKEKIKIHRVGLIKKLMKS
ncbi:MAG: hypothetical protein VW238_01405 [Nitrosomonadales bacterium]